MAAVTSWIITRRGSDPELKGDVHELAILVDRLAKNERRERMSRVRAGHRAPEASGAMEVPPGAENIALAPPQEPIDVKAELRRRVMQFRRG